MRTICLIFFLLSSGSAAIAQQAALRYVGMHSGPNPTAASPRMFLNNAWAARASYTAGLAGAEWLRVAGRHAGLGFGAGVTGVGARVLWYPSDRYEAAFWRGYVSGGVAYAPWRSGATEPDNSAVGVEIGVQHWYQETDWFLDTALGIAGAVRGDWFGRQVLPMARVTLGRGFWL
jgi:hypothetical protein